MYWMPESPLFLLTVGKKDKALHILQHIYSKNTGKNAKDYPVSILK